MRSAKFWNMTTIENEYFAKKLGFEIVERKPDFVGIKATPKSDDTNALDLVHGGFLFSMADYCAALLANQNGKKAVSCNANILYIKPAKPNCEIFATAKTVFESEKTLVALVEIACESETVATMQTQLIIKKSL